MKGKTVLKYSLYIFILFLVVSIGVVLYFNMFYVKPQNKDKVLSSPKVSKSIQSIKNKKNNPSVKKTTKPNQTSDIQKSLQKNNSRGDKNFYNLIKEPERISFRDYDVFQNFYIEKFRRKIEQEIVENCNKQIKFYEERARQLEEKLRQIESNQVRNILKPMPKLKVKAIYCTEKCYAVTNLGIVYDGEKINGRTIVVTPKGVMYK